MSKRKSTTQPISTQPTSFGYGVAACSVAVNANGEIQLTPAGNFRGFDGRPKDVANWVMNAEDAKEVIAFCSARSNDFVIDYEHQTLLAETNGQPAPAAGWFSGAALRWVEGEGLFAKAKWTKRAQGFIDSDEYKYLSPVLLYEKKTGRVKGIIAAALTNNACIDGMDEVLSRAAANFALDGATIENTTTEYLNMDIEELLESLRWMLNLPTLATKEEVIAELQKAVATIKSGNADAVAAAGFSITGLLSSQAGQIAALKAALPDPAKFVAVEVMTELQTEVTTLRNEKVEREVSEVVSAALTAGKLLPAQEGWARELGKSNLALLKQHVDTAQPIAALTNMQTGGKKPEGQPEGELSENELAMCRSTGVSPEDFKKTKLASAQAGI
jgi:phage I-like protein